MNSSVCKPICEITDEELSAAREKNLLDKGARPVEKAESRGESTPHRGRPAARDKLLNELSRLDLKFGRDGEKILAKCPRLGHVETHVVGSSSFRRYLLVTAEAALISISRNGLDEVEDRLRARGFGPTTPTVKSYIRVARDDRDDPALLLNIIIDTGRDDWLALHIGPGGMENIESTDPAAPWFIRPAGFEPLAEPDFEGTDLSRLWQYINIVDTKDRLLLLAWIVHTFRASVPAPLLAFIGEQGGAKSSSCRAIRRIIDPSAAPLLSLPRDERDLFSLIECGHVLAFDNVSSLPDWLSDLFAAIVTGTGRIVRALYTDNEPRLFSAMRALILNGISDFIVRGDLLDRALILAPPPISESKRKTESELSGTFEADLPAILGGLYVLIARVASTASSVHLEIKSRMADYCETGEAVALALGHPSGYFGEIYSENTALSNDVALDSSLVAGAVQKLHNKQNNWAGSPTDLLSALGDEAGERSTASRRWPRIPSALTSELKRVAPALRRAGIEVEFGRENKARYVHIYTVQQERPVVTVVTSTPVQADLLESKTKAAQTPNSAGLSYYSMLENGQELGLF
jgi:hypothetical protein